jgi:DNA-binding transcriptional regulator YbjK
MLGLPRSGELRAGSLNNVAAGVQGLPVLPAVQTRTVAAFAGLPVSSVTMPSGLHDPWASATALMRATEIESNIFFISLVSFFTGRIFIVRGRR